MAVGRRRSTRKAAEPKDGEPPAKKSKTTKNEENTDANDKEETEEAAQDGDDEGEADADAAEGVAEADTNMIEKTEDKEKEKGDAKDDDDDDGRCPACPPKEKDDPPVDVEESWIGCDACKTWYHWRCVRAAHADVEDPSAFNKWYCSSCRTQDPKRTVTLRPPARKSARQKKAQDYASLGGVNNASGSGSASADMDTTADGKPSKPGKGTNGKAGTSGGLSRWAALMYNKPMRDDGFRRVQGVDVTVEWLDADPDALKEPVVIETPEGLGMKMPDEEFTVQDVADAVGEDHPVEVIDVASQSNSPGWTVGKWAAYYNTPASERDRIRNVISLEISGTPLADRILPPRLVRELDWVEKFWPPNKKGKGHQYPKVQLYCLMGVKDAWTDWHIDFAGSSVYYHIVKGSKIFYFIRPTPSNLAAYERWSSSDMQTSVWLGDLVDEVIKIELVTGNTMIIPTGWIHAVATPCDTLVFGGNFLHSYNIGTQLKICGIEQRTNVPKKFRFPHFTRLCWYVAEKYTRDLKAKEEFPPRVLENMDALSSYLVQEARAIEKGGTGSDAAKKATRDAKEAVPGDRVKDAGALAREFRWRVRVAAGWNSDEEGYGKKKGKGGGNGGGGNGGGNVNNGPSMAMAVAVEAKVHGGPNGGKRKRTATGGTSASASASVKDERASEDVNMEGSGPQSSSGGPFRHFRPKGWTVSKETAEDGETLVVAAPRPRSFPPSELDKEHALDQQEDNEFGQQWGEWKESWDGAGEGDELQEADVRRKRTVLVRARRTKEGGVERQRIERVVEHWTWKERSTSAVPNVQAVEEKATVSALSPAPVPTRTPTPAPGPAEEQEDVKMEDAQNAPEAAAEAVAEVAPAADVVLDGMPPVMEESSVDVIS